MKEYEWDTNLILQIHFVRRIMKQPAAVDVFVRFHNLTAEAIELIGMAIKKRLLLSERHHELSLWVQRYNLFEYGL
jgi:hypothetical protein